MDAPKFIQKLWNGSSGKLRPERIERLRTVHKAAVANLKELEARRARAYLDDIGEKEILAIEAEIDRLEQEEAAERRRADDAVIALYLDASEDVATKLDALDHSAILQRKIWDEHSRILARCGVEPLGVVLEVGAGFGLERARLMRRSIAIMEAAREPRTTTPHIAAPAQASQQTNAARPPHKPRMTDSQRQVSLALGDGAGQRRPFARRRDDDAPLAPGQARLVAIRPGVEVTGRQYGAGDTFRTDIPTAHRLLRAGAVELIEESPEPAPNATSAGTDTSLGSEEVRP